MKHLKPIFFFIFLCPVFLSAQPNFWKKPFEPESGKGKGFYVRNGEKELKNKNYLKASAYSAQALTYDLSKRQKKKCLENIKAAYPAFIDGHSQEISVKKEGAQKIISDEEMNRRYNLYKLYSEIQSVNKTLNGLSSDKLKAKKVSFSYSHIDYSNEIEKANSHLDEGRPAAAELHYQKAEKLFDPEKKERLTNKAAAKEYKIADRYSAGYKDVSEKYKKSAELGTALVSIHHFQIRNPLEISKLTALGTEHSLYKTLNEIAKPLAFIEIYPDQTVGIILHQQGDANDFNKKANAVNFANDKKIGTDFRIECIYNGIDVRKDILDPQVDEVEKEIVVREVKTTDSEGNTKTEKIKEKVKATVTTYSKEMTVSISATYKVIDTSTNKVVEEGESSASSKWYHSWARYSGNKKALSDYQKDLAEKKDAAWPEDKPYLKEAGEQLGTYIGGKLKPFVNKEGK